MASTLYTAGLDKPKINLLIYGRPGSGKTTFAATANDHPDMKSALFLNVEGGLLSVAGRGDIKAIDIRDLRAFEDVFWRLINNDEELKQFKTIVIDSGSELQNISLQQIVSEAIADPRKKRSDPDQIEIGDYGKSSAQLKRLFRWFRDSPYHVIITALPSYTFPPGGIRDAEVQPTECGPQFTAKLSEAIQGYQDFVWYLYADNEGNRKLLTEERGIYRAKTRGPHFSRELGQVVNDPKLPAIYDLLLRTETTQLKSPTQKGKE